MNNKLESPKMRSWYAGALALTLSLMAPSWAAAQTMIRSISGGQQAGGDVIRVELSEGLAALQPALQPSRRRLGWPSTCRVWATAWAAHRST